MKKQFIISLIALLVLAGAGSAVAQEWSFGPKVYAGINKRTTVGDAIQINNTLLANVNYGDAIGNSVGAFARYDRPRWYAQAEGMYGKYSLTNAQVNNLSGGFGLYPSVNRTDARLIAGFKPLPWLRLNAGLTTVFNKPVPAYYATFIKSYQDDILKEPSQIDRYTDRIELYQVADALEKSYKKTNIEGQLGIGADVGGLTLDLTYAQNLTPFVDGVTVQNQTYAFKQNYGYWALGLGYKLFPVKRHLLVPRKNKAYERIKQDIPFYRNEFHVAAGLLAEDIGTQSVYENRYTRYLSRRVGIVGGLTYSRNFPTNDDGYSRVTFENRFTLLTGIRLLPLYSRRHTIGLAIGPQLTYTDALQGSFSRQTINGKPVSYLDLGRNSAINELQAGWHGSIDYNFALTDRLLVGSWFRVLGNRFLNMDYGYFGVQAGYRF